MEVSLDEPLNTDWDGNELLLSDILGSEEDLVYKDMDEEVDRQMLDEAISKHALPHLHLFLPKNNGETPRRFHSDDEDSNEYFPV